MNEINYYKMFIRDFLRKTDIYYDKYQTIKCKINNIYFCIYVFDKGFTVQSSLSKYFNECYLQEIINIKYFNKAINKCLKSCKYCINFTSLDL